MLTQLSIKNYALIDDLQVVFSDGFTTITGETGAGKSILLEGLGLVLGSRADRSALRDEGEKCVVEAEFRIGAYPHLERFFSEEDLDYDPQTVLRREIRPNGKSRAFVNDSPVTLEVLARLGARLIDIHSQHQTLELTEHDFQLRVVDALASNGPLLAQYEDLRATYDLVRKQLGQLRQRREAAFREQDYNEFLLGELMKAGLKPGMQEELEARHAELSHAEQIIEWLGQADQLCQDESYGLLALQAQLRQLTARLAAFGPRFEALHQRVQSLYIEADDVAQELGQWAGEQQADPEQLEQVSGQLQQLYDLQRKHGVSTVAELIGLRDRLDQQVSDTAGLDGEIARLEARETELAQTLDGLCAQLRERRATVLPDFTARLQNELGKLGMPHASFRWNLLPRHDFGPTGKDTLELLFTANKGGSHGLLKKTASGGELSRIMLVTKAVLASYEALPTMMFDEIDTGVSGEISNRMGEIMLQMSRHMQVFAITHLPTVASKGQQQYKVYKEHTGQKTFTRMKLLNQDERIRELALMLGGNEASDAALTHARELLN